MRMKLHRLKSLTGKAFSTYWVHNGMLVFSGEKMSKSIGNVVTIDEFLAEHSADTLRFLVLNSGYRSPLTFNLDVIAQSKNALQRMHSALRAALPGSPGAPVASLEMLARQVTSTQVGFSEAMDDDFNSAGAMGHLFELVRAINQTRADGATDAELKSAQILFRSLTSVLGLRLEETTDSGGQADAFIDLLLELRQELRTQKNFAMSDIIRNKLAELNVILEDSRKEHPGAGNSGLPFGLIFQT